MKISLYNIKLKREFDRIDILHWSHLFLVLLSASVEFTTETIETTTALKVLAILVFYKFYFRTKKELYYSFWPFSFILSLYLLSGLYGSLTSYNIPSLFYIYTLALTLLFIEMYILSSPIYYPRISWWEYDFRYRDDLKVTIKIKGQTLEGRLTDLRREAGCIALFEEFDVGSKMTIIISEINHEIDFEVEIMSKRRYSLGRAFTYGVKFHFDNEIARNNFMAFCSFWKSERSSKKRLKSKNG